MLFHRGKSFLFAMFSKLVLINAGMLRRIFSLKRYSRMSKASVFNSQKLPRRVNVSCEYSVIVLSMVARSLFRGRSGPLGGIWIWILMITKGIL